MSETQQSTSDSAQNSSPRPGIEVRFLIFGVGFIGIQVLVGCVVGVGFIVWLLGTERLASLSDTAALETLLPAFVVPFTASSAVPLTALVFLWCCACRRRLDGRSWQSMGFQWPATGGATSLPAGFGLGTAAMLMSAIIVAGAGGYLWTGIQLSWMMLVMAPVLLLMAFTEELVFRGYLLQNLIEAGKTGSGVVFSSLVFWLMHGMNPGVWDSPVISINLFAAGIIHALAYVLSGNIWYPTLMHFGWNVTQGLVLDIPVSGLDLPGMIGIAVADGAPDWLTGGRFGLEGSLVTTVAEVVLILFLVRLIRHPSLRDDI
ncbi:MAG: CPBP family intramembrane glutamic endopeptidase [Fuerstiella sp.]